PHDGGVNDPPNGGTVSTGQKFTLDLMINDAGHTVTAQQAYISFTNSLMDNVDFATAGCNPSQSVTPDQTIFETVLQNEVCNGPGQCVFRGVPTNPGLWAYASGALTNPPYNGPDFRVATTSFCAHDPGVAVLHWQFAPPDPITRNTDIVDVDSHSVTDRVCYVDYVKIGRASCRE